MPQSDSDTICAIATPAGRSGVGIIRISGDKALVVAEKVLGFIPTPRYAHYSNFLDANGESIDQGIAIYFKNPNSFTGEDTLELQGHGGAYVLKALRERVLSLGVRPARPGEFSERAFLNNKIDLLQAEAIADLIDASSQQAARSAMRTLQGEFSSKITELVQRLIAVRVNVEAAIDFSDEDIDVLSDTKVQANLQQILDDLIDTFRHAQQGALLKDGMNVVIAGKPNAGKSSLLNALSGTDTAIVTDVPGTTRDLLSEEIDIDGMPVHIFDTAGLRDSEDIVEKEGIKRAQAAINQADRILLVVDCTEVHPSVTGKDVEMLFTPLELMSDKSTREHSILQRITLLFNKIDLAKDVDAEITSTRLLDEEITTITLSAKHGPGIDLLTEHLKSCVGYNSTDEGAFVARERHLVALRKAEKLVNSAYQHVLQQSPLELVAEDLRIAQSELGSITGEFTSDDLLGEIFSSFCVGK